MEQQKSLELIVVSPEEPNIYRLPSEGRVHIGRHEENDIPVHDSAVSHRHAILCMEEPLRLVDLGSLNGIRVMSTEPSDGTARLIERKVASGQACTIAPGDGLLIGKTLLIVRESPSYKKDAAPFVLKMNTSMPQSIVACDERMMMIYSRAYLLARSNLNILILGETGVGKDVMAKHIHQRSLRERGPFVSLNCAALNESLAESELFGYEAGAFTGAQRPKPGLIEIANGGTLFLDELGELSATIQAKLLRVLEAREVIRVGGIKSRPVDIRVVSATNRCLERDVSMGTFRKDLFFRLNGASLIIPPLRERPQEIEPLARLFLEQLMSVKTQVHHVTQIGGIEISMEALAKMQNYLWPGNIRELRTAMERALTLCSGNRIEAQDLDLGEFTPDGMMGSKFDPPLPLFTRAPSLVRSRILEALDHCAGNQTRAAKMLGISRGTLIARLNEYGIRRPKKIPVTLSRKPSGWSE